MERKKILVAIDGSDHSQAVVDKAIEFAKSLPAEVLLVYCHARFPVLLGEPYRDKQIADILAESEKLIRPYLKRLQREDIAVEDRLMEEPAGKMITEIAEIEKCDLIVMGSRGLSNLASMIVGSVTHRVLQTAPCPVLVIR
jgi:nucleotide-binding universal stress UspA family protein